MIGHFRSVAPLVLLASLLAAVALPAAADNPRIGIETTLGYIELELYPDKAPRTVKNFLAYLEYEYFDDMIFHRVIDDWVIQTGNHDIELNSYETEPPIRNEATNGLKNVRGSVAMARGADPHSASSQWFINLADNPELDHRARTLRTYGYCVFGKVIEGMEVADAIGDIETQAREGFKNLPVTSVVIKTARLLNP
ncbi:MAG: peptidyl-prolyl cis-trans isomerase [Gammaproteobacteria bacterium]|nr:peptidyl-prolyl cis-trans isomerase [Gammaproteobacteria bacterium]